MASLDMKVGRIGQLTFDVRVLAIEESYGRIRYKVGPVAGKGSALVEKLKKQK